LGGFSFVPLVSGFSTGGLLGQIDFLAKVDSRSQNDAIYAIIESKSREDLRMKKQASPQLTAAILEAVDNQLRDSTPPEAKETYDRLVTSGISDKEARRLIAVALSSEMFQMLKYKKDYSQERYIASLRKLPKLPWD
jgi:hypothetical protein